MSARILPRNEAKIEMWESLRGSCAHCWWWSKLRWWNGFAGGIHWWLKSTSAVWKRGFEKEKVKGQATDAGSSMVGASGSQTESHARAPITARVGLRMGLPSDRFTFSLLSHSIPSAWTLTITGQMRNFKKYSKICWSLSHHLVKSMLEAIKGHEKTVRQIIRQTHSHTDRQGVSNGGLTQCTIQDTLFYPHYTLGGSDIKPQEEGGTEVVKDSRKNALESKPLVSPPPATLSDVEIRWWYFGPKLSHSREYPTLNSIFCNLDLFEVILLFEVGFCTFDA